MSNKKTNTTNNKIILAVASVVLVCSLGYGAYYLIQEKKAEDLNKELIDRHTETVVITQQTTAETTTVPVTETEATTSTTPEPEPLVILDSMKSFVEENPDTAGWITVGGTNIDNVVVHTDNNDYYLERDYYGNYSQPGTVFADYRCVVNDYDFNQSDNIVLYGHNQANGTMFGTLQRYKITKQNTSKFDFYLQHPTFTFSNLYEEYTYKIIALFVCEVDPKHTRDGVVFDYHNYIRFGSKEKTYEEFMQNVTERSQIITGVDVNENDQFLTLSTCSNEFEPSRFVVIGRKVRDGESPEVDTSVAKLNPDAKEPDWNYIYNN